MGRTCVGDFGFIFVGLGVGVLYFIAGILILTTLIKVFFLLPGSVILVVRVVFLLTICPYFGTLLVRFYAFPSVGGCVVSPCCGRRPSRSVRGHRSLNLSVRARRSISRARRSSRRSSDSIVFRSWGCLPIRVFLGKCVCRLRGYET